MENFVIGAVGVLVLVLVVILKTASVVRKEVELAQQKERARVAGEIKKMLEGKSITSEGVDTWL